MMQNSYHARVTLPRSTAIANKHLPEKEKLLTPSVANAPRSQVQMVSKCKQTGHRKAIFYQLEKLAHIRSEQPGLITPNPASRLRAWARRE